MARNMLFPYELLVKDGPEASKTVLAVSSVLGCPPDLDSKTLLQKAPYTLTAAHEKNQAGTEMNPSSLLARFHCARRFCADF